MRPRANVYGEYRSSEKTIDRLEFESYRDYLRSPTWKAIRSSVLSARPNCELCGCDADQVHHFCYHSAVMVGAVNGLLVPVCDSCHKQIEFGDDGAKLTVLQAQSNLLKLLSLAGKHDIANRLLNAEKRLVRANNNAANAKPSKYATRGICAAPKVIWRLDENGKKIRPKRNRKPKFPQF